MSNLKTGDRVVLLDTKSNRQKPEGNLIRPDDFGKEGTLVEPDTGYSLYRIQFDDGHITSGLFPDRYEAAPVAEPTVLALTHEVRPVAAEVEHDVDLGVVDFTSAPTPFEHVDGKQCVKTTKGYWVESGQGISRETLCDRHTDGPEVAPAARPTVSFSTNPRSTARLYAGQLLRALNLESVDANLLTMIARGEKVDALNLQASLYRVLSQIAVSYGNNAQRDNAATKARHLAHIANATVRHHVDRLPAYEEGQRSRLVAKTKESLEAARVELDEARRMVDAAEARAELLGAALEKSQRQASREARTKRYAMRHLTENYAAQVIGFEDGLLQCEG